MGQIGAPEILIILLILILLFGAKKLPDLARSTGRSLRIFKAETKGVMDDDDDEQQSPQQSTPPQITSTNVSQPQPTEPGQPAPAADPLPPTHTEK
jgi:sec-independent protein translocase protein TatA